MLLLACATADPASEGVEPVVVAPDWDATELSAEIEAFTALPPVSPWEPYDAYLARMAFGDADCPGSPTQMLGANLRGCTADSGYTYAGVATLSEGPGDGWVLVGDFEIFGPDGARFAGGGGASASAGADGAWNGAITGTWVATDEVSWLGTGTSAYWSELGGTVGGTPWIQVDGGLTYGGVTIWADALRYDASQCADAPSGALQVRDPSGGWYTLAWDACEPCADLTFEGAREDPLCVDVTGWLGALRTAGVRE